MMIKEARVLMTAFGFGVYSMEYVPRGLRSAPPPVESVGFDPSRTETIPDPDNPGRAYVMADRGFAPSGLENVTPDNWKSLRNAIRVSGNEMFEHRLEMFEHPS